MGLGDWENCWTDENGNPEQFSTEQEAREELENHIEELNEEFEAGNLLDPSDIEDYRVVEVL